MEECLVCSAVNGKIGGLSCGFYIFVYIILIVKKRAAGYILPE